MNNDTEKIEQHFGRVTSLIGERSRAIMLWNLLDGRAYTATELAICADISAQAASNHLSKLVKANLLAVDNQGRHKYYRFKNDKVAQVIETIASLLPVDNNDKQKEIAPLNGIKYARTCYDHLAGKAGVAITNGLLEKEILVEQKNNYTVSALGVKWFGEIGILRFNLAAIDMTSTKSWTVSDFAIRSTTVGSSFLLTASANAPSSIPAGTSLELT